ncbi:hypothetical protein TNIN_201671 [Trichonephila inaurata madagascariensis]|uniref:Uncharacterized protein n=1 Tax=Trichonephila inaurata madagascariensis TaxID=2747483 RepID=A0A8X6I7S0_9ARAC|nr:hypothetical protein TNIN_201671 [Trichonephila inaurata madagascariensis]
MSRKMYFSICIEGFAFHSSENSSSSFKSNETIKKMQRRGISKILLALLPMIQPPQLVYPNRKTGGDILSFLYMNKKFFSLPGFVVSFFSQFFSENLLLARNPIETIGLHWSISLLWATADVLTKHPLHCVGFLVLRLGAKNRPRGKSLPLMKMQRHHQTDSNF